MAYPTAFPQAGEEFAGKYLIEHVIGVGHELVIYAATQRTTGRPCAIRWSYPDPDAPLANPDPAPHTELDVDPSTGDVCVVGRFRHPNMLEVFEVDRADGSNYVVMDWPDGESLQARLQRWGPMAPAEVSRLLGPCLRALDEIHAAGVLHLDLKPASLLICAATESQPEQVRVLDFDIAASAADATGASLVAPPGLASPYYRAPEQLGGLEVDHRADVYAFGAILYEALTGRPPFAPNLTAARFMPRASTAQLLPIVVEPIVSRAMARQVTARFQSLRELADALEACATAPRSAAIVRRDPMADAAPRKPERRTPFQVELPSRMPANRPRPPLRLTERWLYAVGVIWLVGCFTVLIVRYLDSRGAGAVVSYDAATDPRGRTLVELADPPLASSPRAVSALAAESRPVELPLPLPAVESRAPVEPPVVAPPAETAVPVAVETAPVKPVLAPPVVVPHPVDDPARPVGDSPPVPSPVPLAPRMPLSGEPEPSRSRVPEMKLL